MLQSIRWRLVASFALLTLFSVTAVGVVAVFLVDRYAGREAAESLTASAEAMAVRSQPLLVPAIREAELEELTQAAAFLDGVRVRVLNEHGDQLVDTGHGGRVEQMIWVGGDGGSEEHGDGAGLAALLAGPVTISIVGEATEAADAAQLARDLAEESASLRSRALDALDAGEPLGEIAIGRPGQQLVVIRRPEGGVPRFDYVLGGVDVGPEREARLVLPPLDEGLVLKGVVELGSPDAPLPGEMLDGRHLDGRLGTIAASRLPHQSVVVPIGEPLAPVGFIEITEAGDPAAEARSTAARAFAVAGAAATLLSVLVGLVVSRSLTAPLAGLTRAADEMSAGDLTARAPVRGQDEIAVLGVQFNSMADRLQVSFAELAAERDALRRFIADASHELRTPITALKTYNSLLADDAADDPVAQREFLADSRAQLDRLEWITHNLLDLSRLEAGLIALDLGECDAAELLTTAVAPHEVGAAAKGLTVDVSVPPAPLTLSCDGSRLQMALGNLIENAVKFTPDGGSVRAGAEVVGTESEPRVLFWVEDTGPGISPEEAQRVFDRSYKGGEGVAAPREDAPGTTAEPREDAPGTTAEGCEHPPGTTAEPREYAPVTTGEPQVGSGLGLAIARSVVEAHGGTIRLASSGPEGSRFEIDVPAASA